MTGSRDSLTDPALLKLTDPALLKMSDPARIKFRGPIEAKHRKLLRRVSVFQQRLSLVFQKRPRPTCHKRQFSSSSSQTMNFNVLIEKVRGGLGERVRRERSFSITIFSRDEKFSKPVNGFISFHLISGCPMGQNLEKQIVFIVSS